MWKKFGKPPEPQKLTLSSNLSKGELDSWLALNLENKNIIPEVIKSIVSTKKRHGFVGKYNNNTFELMLAKDKSNQNLNFAPPLVRGKFYLAKNELKIDLDIGVDRPNWFWKITQTFLSIWLCAYLIIPLLGMIFEGLELVQILKIELIFMLTFPIVAIILFSTFLFLPLALTRKAQKRTFDILMQEFKVLEFSP